MRCKQFYDIISAFVDSEANALETAALQEHLKSCEICKNELASQYALSGMVKDCHNSGICNIDVSKSVMSKIIHKNELDDIFEYAVDADAVISRQTRKFKYVAAAFMCAITAAAVFSARTTNNMQMAAAEPETYEYTAYIYDHLNTPDLEYVSNSGNLQLNMVSFVK